MTSASRARCASSSRDRRQERRARLAAQRFDVLLTVDRNLEYQQNLHGAAVAVIVMHAPSNDIAVLQPLMRQVLETIPTAARGKVTNIKG